MEVAADGAVPAAAGFAAVVGDADDCVCAVTPPA